MTTPNRLTSDGINPYHVHEYVAAELAAHLRRRFGEVEMRGVGASPAVRRDFEARSRRIRAILRLDPLRLRERLPRALVLRLFALGAILVRTLPGRPREAAAASWRDFPIEPVDDRALDLVAICRRPLRGGALPRDDPPD